MPCNCADYQEDFYAWTVEQGRLLRSGEFSSIDALNIAEEIEALGRSDRREILSRLTVLLTHLLKWQIAACHEIEQLDRGDSRATPPDREAVEGIA
jgi:Domain of unknown function DUF29